MVDAPLTYRWLGDAMAPVERFRAEADKRFVIGETYRLSEVEDRTRRSHRHYFAIVEQGWANLPDELVTQFPTAEKLRKHALIMAGYRHERRFVASSKQEARRLAAFLSGMEDEDYYAVISVHENTVLECRPMSQSKKSMPTKGMFEKSKADVLDYLAKMLGVSSDDLQRARAA